MHSFKIGTESQPFGCVLCLGEDRFFEQLSVKTELIRNRAEQVLNDSAHDGAGGRNPQNSLSVFGEFFQAVDHLNRLCAHRVLNELEVWPLVLHVVMHQQRCTDKLKSHLEMRQTVWWYAQPDPRHVELVRCFAQLNLNAGQNSSGPSVHQQKLAWNKKPILAVLFHEIRRHLEFFINTVLQLMRDPGVDFLILAAQEPDMSNPIVADLYGATSDNGWRFILEGRELAVDLPTTITPRLLDAMRHKIRGMKITCLLSFSGSSADWEEQWRGMCRPGIDVHHYISLPIQWLPSDPLFNSCILLDPCFLQELPSTADNVLCISCIRPPLSCMGEIVRSERKPFVEGTGQVFRILALVDQDQPIIPPQMLAETLLLLMELPEAKIAFCGLDLMQIASIRREMEAFALKHELDKHFFDQRSEFWGCRPAAAYTQRIRNEVHVCLAMCPVDDGVNVALCAGTVVVTQRDSRGGGDVRACGAISMLKMLGLGALALPYGVGSGGLVRQLYNDGETLQLVQRILDHHATDLTTSLAFFDQDRTAKDLAAVACVLHGSDKIPQQNQRNFISRQPEQPYFVLGGDGLLYQTARVHVRVAEDLLGPNIFLLPTESRSDLMDCDLLHSCLSLDPGQMDQDQGCIGQASGADHMMIELPHNSCFLDLIDDADVNEGGDGAGPASGEAQSAGDLLGRGAVLHPGPVLTFWTGRRRRGGRRGQRRPTRYSE